MVLTNDDILFNLFTNIIMIYKHTQTGYLILVILFVVALLFKFVLDQAGFDNFVLAIMIVVLFVVASFVSLTVMIDQEYLRIKFGYGFFRKRFLLEDIVSVKMVRNHWYYGWGIRFWMWPRMWIFNISGFDAVEIMMKKGSVYRIGTDEPKELEHAISQVVK